MSFGAPTPVFIGHGNVITLLPYADIVTDERLDMSGATKVSVCIGSVTADSDSEPDAISWEEDPDDGWVIKLQLGLLPGLEEGEATLRVVAYDGEYTNGLVLTHDMTVEVIGSC